MYYYLKADKIIHGVGIVYILYNSKWFGKGTKIFYLYKVSKLIVELKPRK